MSNGRVKQKVISNKKKIKKIVCKSSLIKIYFKSYMIEYTIFYLIYFEVMF